jgi:hypothetical protein
MFYWSTASYSTITNTSSFRRNYSDSPNTSSFRGVYTFHSRSSQFITHCGFLHSYLSRSSYAFTNSFKRP